MCSCSCRLRRAPSLERWDGISRVRFWRGSRRRTRKARFFFLPLFFCFLPPLFLAGSRGGRRGWRTAAAAAAGGGRSRGVVRCCKFFFFFSSLLLPAVGIALVSSHLHVASAHLLVASPPTLSRAFVLTWLQGTLVARFLLLQLFYCQRPAAGRGTGRLGERLLACSRDALPRL